MHVRPATPSEFDIVTDILAEANVSYSNLTPSDMEHVLVCQTSNDAWFDRISVLRTVAILPEHRLPDRGNEICGIVGLTFEGAVDLVRELGLSRELGKEETEHGSRESIDEGQNRAVSSSTPRPES